MRFLSALPVPLSSPVPQQMGNAVCPQVAAALGRCLALAALHASPPGKMLLAVPDKEYDEVGGGRPYQLLVAYWLHERRLLNQAPLQGRPGLPNPTTPP